MENSDIELKENEEVKKSEKPQRKYEKQLLSGRERRFIKAFTEIGAETYGLAHESALKAGYVEGQVEHTARRLMANPKVLVAIDELYADRMEGTPTNLARIMSNLDNTESLALKTKSMPTLTKIAELRGKYLDIWSSINAASTEDSAEMLARMTDEARRRELYFEMMRCNELASGKLSAKYFGGDTTKRDLYCQACAIDQPTVDEIGEHIKTVANQTYEQIKRQEAI